MNRSKNCHGLLRKKFVVIRVIRGKKLSKRNGVQVIGDDKTASHQQVVDFRINS